VGAASLGDLDRQVPDAAAGPVDQHPLAGRHPSGVHQGLPRGQTASGSVAASPWDSPAGLRASWRDGAATYSAYALAARGKTGNVFLVSGAVIGPGEYLRGVAGWVPGCKRA
jgi:hypothetical protein